MYTYIYKHVHTYTHYCNGKKDRDIYIHSSPRGHGHGRPLRWRRGPALGAPGAEAALQDHVDGVAAREDVERVGHEYRQRDSAEAGGHQSRVRLVEL